MVAPEHPQMRLFDDSDQMGVSVEELIGEDAAGQERKRGRTPKLMQHMERINALPKTQQSERPAEPSCLPVIGG